METYYGTKVIQAEPREMDGNPGYKVVYEPDGYASWSPADVFDAAYKPSGRMNFGHALEALKRGGRAARSGWNGKGMWIVLMPPLNPPPFNMQAPDPKVLDSQAYIAMWTADQKYQRCWLPSEEDMLSDDWSVVGGGGGGSLDKT